MQSSMQQTAVDVVNTSGASLACAHLRGSDCGELTCWRATWSIRANFTRELMRNSRNDNEMWATCLLAPPSQQLFMAWQQTMAGIACLTTLFFFLRPGVYPARAP